MGRLRDVLRDSCVQKLFASVGAAGRLCHGLIMHALVAHATKSSLFVDA